jgi:acyl-CoA thioesterase-1
MSRYLLCCLLFLGTHPLFAAPDNANGKPRILAIGDSLTEGYGVPKEVSYPTVLQAKLRATGMPDAVVVNAGTSGATSAFGTKTLRFHLKKAKPDLVILALGANDGLRGLSTKDSEKNINDTIVAAKAAGCKVLLVGMQAPPNYGKKFPADFAAIFPKLAKEQGVPLVPFLLDHVAGEPKLNNPDGIHPNEEGYKIVAEQLVKPVQEALK